LEATVPMSRTTKTIPWHDRWNEPTLDQLVAPIDENRRKAADSLIEHTGNFEAVERTIIWYGQSWRWTIQFTLPDAQGDPHVLAYLVPVPNAPIFCVPFREDILTRLPLRRLNKYIRDGLRGAKCAVELHWAMWTPSNNVEVEQLIDLIKRKHKLLRTPSEAPAAD
jgi:hypothetical protein